MMKRTLIALILCAASGYVFAQENETLEPITVERVAPGQIFITCEPPNGALACARLHELIRQNFTPREIGMLFGGSTAYLEYPTAYDRTRQRYDAFMQDLEDNGVPITVSNDY